MDNRLPVKKKASVVDKQTQQPIKKPINNQTSLPQEQKEVIGSFFKEGEPRIIEKKEFEPSSEVKPWVAKVKSAEEITLPQPIKDEYGQILIEAAQPVKPRIVLPLAKPKIKRALQKKIVESVRWLAEWCLRLIKMFPKRVTYESNN